MARGHVPLVLLQRCALNPPSRVLHAGRWKHVPVCAAVRCAARVLLCCSFPRARPSPNCTSPPDFGPRSADILGINNLVGLDNLVKLKLDNNKIWKIQNLGHLVNLEWLGVFCMHLFSACV